MFFYILIIPVTIASILMIGHLIRLRKHDKVLFAFCANRREIISVIGSKNFNLSYEEYHSLRRLLNETSSAIHYFNEYKPFHFNLRKNFAYAKKLMDSQDNTTLNEETKELYDKFVYSMLTAFFTFTPFIKSEIVLRIIALIARLVAKIGVLKIKKRALAVVRVVTWIEDEAMERKLLPKFGFSLRRA